MSEKKEKAERLVDNLKIIQKWLRDNVELETVDIKVVERIPAVLFRCPGTPKIDFYPEENKWKTRNKTYHGNARACIDFLMKRRKR